MGKLFTNKKETKRGARLMDMCDESQMKVDSKQMNYVNVTYSDKWDMVVGHTKLLKII